MQWLKVLVVSILAVAPVAGDETVSHPQLGFRLTVPDGFVQDPERVQGKAIYAFQRLPAGDQKMGMFIVVSRLDGVLGREKIDPKQLSAQNPQITIVGEKWKGFEIEVFRVPEQVVALQVLTFNAQAPLKPEAVQIAVIGEAAREDELRGVLRSVLGTLDGQTNWLDTEQRVTRFAEGITRLATTAGVLAVIAVVVRRAFRNRKSARRAAETDTPADGGRDAGS